MKKRERVLRGICLTMVAVLFVLVLSVSCSTEPPPWEYVRGTVINTYYSPASSAVGMGPTISASGDVGFAMTHAATPEQWVLLIDVHPTIEEVVPLHVSADTFARYKVGDTIELQCVFYTRRIKCRYAP